MATCPSCGINSRDPSGPIQIRPVLVSKPVGTFAGRSQMKTSAFTQLQMSCRCGWSIRGRIDGESFIADPATQRFPRDG